MWYRDKTFWRNLLITAVILGSVYTCTAYFAIQDRERQEEIHKQGEEVYGLLGYFHFLAIHKQSVTVGFDMRSVAFE